MRTINVTERPSRKTVVVGDLPFGVDRQEVVDFALKAAGETRSSHFGIDWLDDGSISAIVTIYVS